MKKIKYLNPGVFFGLILIFNLILMNCAQQSATLIDEEYASENDEFQSELLGMLELSEDDLGENSDFLDKLEVGDSQESQDMSAFSDANEEEGSLNDILSLLLEEDTNAADMEQTIQSPPEASGPTDSGSSTLKSDVEQLENVFDEKSQMAEDLRRQVEEKNGRISTLESQLASNASQRNVRISQSLTDVRGDSPFTNGYRNARAQFESFKYSDAIASFQNLLQSNPNHSLADNCQYWIGECYFGMKQYQQAILEFQKVFMYQRIDKHDDAQLMIALCYMKSGQNDRAKSEFEKFLNTYPDSEYSGVARRYYQKM
ncbi:tetratricopeptide repeat protein [candidate division KSB1 bacterium]|nr:tetratricopeptide repeat protein [candidate division KSB1 bacterium]